MADTSLYKFCLRRVANCLRDGIYKSCHVNPFCSMPYPLVNDLMAATLDLQREEGFRADDLEQLLTSGKLREVKIYGMEVRHDIVQVLNSLTSNLPNLEIFHLTEFVDPFQGTEFVDPFQGNEKEKPRADISEALENVLRNVPKLIEFHSSFVFDLKALRNCKKLRGLRLHFVPKQPLYDFLSKENGLFQPHKYLEFISLCQLPRLSRRIFNPNETLPLVPDSDVVVLLLYCPELNNLGHVDPSGALLQLQKMGRSLSELKLRHFYWQDQFHMDAVRDSEIVGQLRYALLQYPLIEELGISAIGKHSLLILPCLRNLKNLVFLNITLYCFEYRERINCCNVLQEICPQLKHLFLSTNTPIDLSKLLQNCPKLESLGISENSSSFNDALSKFTHPVVSLPNLKRLTCYRYFNLTKQFFSLLSDCNELIELFLIAPFFDDETLEHFLRKNSLLNLEKAYLNGRNLTEYGFMMLLLNAPELEIIEGIDFDLSKEYYERIRNDTNHKAICNKNLLSRSDDFFWKRRTFNNCE